MKTMNLKSSKGIKARHWVVLLGACAALTVTASAWAQNAQRTESAVKEGAAAQQHDPQQTVSKDHQDQVAAEKAQQAKSKLAERKASERRSKTGDADEEEEQEDR